MTTAMHPTRQKLLDVASELLESASPDEITVDMVLQRSGISKGSLYHHYRDFQDLIESALSNLFVYNVDQSIAALSAVVHGSPDKKTLLAGLRRVTEVTQSSEMRNRRDGSTGNLIRARQPCSSRLTASARSLTM